MKKQPTGEICHSSKCMFYFQSPSCHRPPERKDSKWEILTNLESGQNYNILPKKTEGLLTKKRKWPMKGKKVF